MINLVKKILKFINEDFINAGMNIFYKRQLKRDLASDLDKLDDEYDARISAYWDQYNVKINYDWHNWYSSVNHRKEVEYIPENIFYSKILPFYNNLAFGEAFGDKGYYNLWFPNVQKPNTIAKNVNGFFYNDDFKPLDKEEVIQLCKEHKKIIIKPSVDSGSGRNIIVLKNDDPVNFNKELTIYLKETPKDFVIQSFIEQHETLNKLNESSVNTIRVMSFLDQEGVSILSSHIRVGEADSIYDHNGYVIGVKDNGDLGDFAIKYKIGDRIPLESLGFSPETIRIPSYEKVKNIIKDTHPKFPHYRLISWDFAIDKFGEPVLIEFNLRYQGLNHHQLLEGSLFGEQTDEVLTEVYGKKNK